MKTLNKGITKHITENNTKHVNSQSSLPAPPILQGRAVNDKYPQMPAPTVEGFSNEDGTGTGYLDVSWEPIEDVTKYQIILFNGSIFSYWDIPANETTWTTKDKGLFPTGEQLESGQVNFIRDGSGTDFPGDPSTFYNKAYEINGGLNYSNSNEYLIRITAVHEDGANPISYASKIIIPEETPIIEELNLQTMSEVEKIAFYEAVAMEASAFGVDKVIYKEALTNAFNPNSELFNDLEATVDYINQNSRSDLRIMTVNVMGSILNVAIGTLATGSLGYGSVSAYIKKVGKDQAKKMFTKTLKSKLVAIGAAPVAYLLSKGLDFALDYMDLGGKLASFIDSKDKKTKEWVD
ncbi:hypothetical protein ACFVRR_13545 [Gottfriedia sp. NPDC057948]|uniref:hypothetical protein n=1 Tax=Gottfriedia sp. NPDC057948 TaxID=3346287 RepID=UPI0036DEC364